MKTINVAHTGEGGHRPAAADVNPVATFEASVPNGSPGDAPHVVQVTVTLGDGLPVSHRRAEDVQARRRAEDEALDAEDVITQAEEANAVDPVG